MPNAPGAVSLKSKRKLQAFQFQPDNSNADNKENEVYQKSMYTAKKSESAKLERQATESASQPELVPCPQTPVGRIALSDLIANPEDALSRPIVATPLDQVEWKNGPGSSEPSCSARSAQRRRKRARSSSPTTHSQTEKSKHFGTKHDPLDLENIGRSLRTPKHEDPLSLLWANYAGLRGLEEDDESTLPPLIPVSSSPQTPASSKKENLRRTASCGTEWPTSSTKKRRLSERDPYSKAKGIFAAKKDAILAKSATNQSKVSMLVDSIHQSLLKKTAIESGAPSSSSPLPERHVESLRHQTHTADPLQTIIEQCEDIGTESPEDSRALSREGSSDYSDMDLDADDPELLDALATATQKPRQDLHENSLPQIRNIGPPSKSGNTRDATIGSSRPHTRPSLLGNLLFENPNTRMLHKASELEVPESHAIDLFDDFNNSDDDDFATELVELANKIDSQDISQFDGMNEQTSTLRTQPAVKETGVDDFDDVFDDNDDDYDDLWKKIDSAESKAGEDQMRSINRMNQDSRIIKRFFIQDVFESHFKNAQDRQQPEKVLSIKGEKLQQLFIVHLRQSWYDTRCTKGSYIHLIGDFDKYGNCIVDDKDNMIILHPDHLISATTVADSFSCTRRATLQDRVKATSPAEAPQVYGHLIHEVFGEALRKNKWDFVSLRNIVESLIPMYIESLYEINTSISDAVEYVMGKMPELTAWASIFVTGRLDPEATIRDRNGVVVPMAIEKLLELEEHVWSPMYGLKGNIDATVQVQMHLPEDKDSRTLTVPFELKTGKRDSNEMHRAQTALYTLLLSDRYDLNITSGILYYLETSKTFRIEGIRNEIRHMIIQRNELACYVHDKLDLPPMIKREHLCKKCFAQTACFTYHKLVEDGDGETSGMKDIFTDAVGHLKESQKVFFKKWDDLLTKEERDTMKFKRELWTMLSKEREALGRCFGDVVIEPGSAVENADAPKVNRYTYTFIKHKSKPGFSFTESQITIGEPIVVSDEKGHFALAIGFVTNVRPARITVAVDRRLQNARTRQPGFDPVKQQTFSAIMDVNKDGESSTPLPTNLETPKVYRIDKDEFATGMATARNNVLRIMEKDLWRARELRQLIIDNKAPSFKQIASAYTLSGPASQQNLNVGQRKAIEKVMSAKDYALVLGMPGTGKTTTIAHIIRALVSQGKTVLLTSYTHTAVDNILLKIKDDNIPILRLGATGKVHPDVANFADLSGCPKRTIEELEASWTRSKVVATTCLGINHAIFNHRKFDYCIVDEASQITLPVCLGPIRLASTFILVGDHFQLPPLVQNKEAQEGGLDISLFKLLSDAQPSSVVNLEHQYRMAEDIMLLSNQLIYDGRLKCGTPTVASRTLKIPNLSAGLELHHFVQSTGVERSQHFSKCLPKSSSCWISQALDPSRRTIFINTDTMSNVSALGAPESVNGNGNRITNVLETILVAQILAVLVRSGVPPKDIGVITFYRSQLAVLKSTVKSLVGSVIANELEMHTADKYQGRDKEVILLSCVRSNENHHVGELLKDWRRVNVALTRARSKLMMIGSLSTLGGSGVPVLEGLSQILKEKSWVLGLPASAQDMHHFEGMATQTQPHSNFRQVVSPLKNTAGRQTQSTDSGKRVPFASVSGNVKTGMRKPDKVVHGVRDVDKFLDRHPLVKDVMEDAAFGQYDDENVYVAV